MSAQTIKYVRPPITPYQRDAIFCQERWSMVFASTKSGKSLGCLLWLLEQALLHGGRNKNFWWVAPTHSQARIMFRRLKSYLPHGQFGAQEVEQTITLPNGSVIWFKSGALPDNLYGEDVFAAVLDEVTRLPESSWVAVRSTLTATRGPARMIGNMRTRTWAYELSLKIINGSLPVGGPDGWRFTRINAWQAVEAGVLARAEVESAKAVLTTDEFAELYLAEARQRDRFFSRVPLVIPISEIEARISAATTGPTGPTDPNAASFSRTVRGWDFAVTEPKPGSDPDWTAGVLTTQVAGVTYIRDISHFRKAPDASLATFIDLARVNLCDQVVEEERGAAGKMFIATLKNAMGAAALPVAVHPSPVTGDKMTRAFAVASDWNDGKVIIADASWTEEFLKETDTFGAGGRHDDMIDGMSAAYNFLRGRTYMPGDFYLPLDDNQLPDSLDPNAASTASTDSGVWYPQ